MKLYNQARKYGARAAAGVSMALLSAVAFAQTATPVTTATDAIEGAQTDMTTVLLALLGLSVATWVIFKIIRLFRGGR